MDIGGRARALAMRFLRDTSGATAIEYGLIAGLTFLAIVGALRVYADRVGAMYQYIGNNVAKSS
ncbi:Flp family type IVb pilin [Methylobacterium sp. J-068]|nr:Flp family type IVb pilin [Methylobacterium sp. J-068]